MKLLIFVISLFIVAVQSQSKGLDIDECIVELGINKDEFKSLKLDDRTSKCILACTFKHRGIVKDAKVVFDVAFDMTKKDEHTLSDKDIEKKVNSCIEKAHQEANECDVSYAFLLCMTSDAKVKN